MRTLSLQIVGLVQGVGFRPFVHRLALEHHFHGSVANKGSFVDIQLQTAAKDPELAEQAFVQDLLAKAPARAQIMHITSNYIDVPACNDFQIIPSINEDGAIFVSPDIATCELCTKELFDKTNRRYLHPFINCTNCGPRLTILDAMPYDRERTSMHKFPMCTACANEYTSKESRRYDAQPVCCNECGPEVFLLGTQHKGLAAITKVRELLLNDAIVAIKGIGGFHLACNASSEKAVASLRARKHRPAKPFAVMFRDLQSLKTCCKVPDTALTLLTNWQKPIVLLPKIQSATALAPALAPDNPYLGVMLPYTPLHLLLFLLPDHLPPLTCLVMTSANISGVPICHTTDAAEKELAGIADYILTHNRTIRLRSDDSVVALEQHKPFLLRRSRGYAPLPIMVDGLSAPPILAMGADLKNTICIAKDGFFYLSPHIGDLADIRAQEALMATYKRFAELFRIQPQYVACDSHPLYHSRRLASELGLPVIEIQHHYAHIVACLAEHNCQDEVLGVALDGTGYGIDGTIWGGELLQASYAGFKRLGSLDKFPLTGGDLAAKEGYRVAVSLLQTLYGTEDAVGFSEKLGLCSLKEAQIQAHLTAKSINTVPTTSAGRLFDAVSALLGFLSKSSFEGEAACKLQFAAERASKAKIPTLPEEIAARLSGELLPVPLDKDGHITLKLQDLLKTLIDAQLQGLPQDILALYFHHYLAQGVTQLCLEAQKTTGISTCALGGGVFQNSLFRQLCCQYLRKENFKVLIPTEIPANDGGIALGQAVALSWQLAKKK
ncbi:MAG: carbamoyltransferase HypF [Desulfovibrionaceae bacterium]|nr:carbamoyltransferase HypF [Desulfovibrionaceae bacterium]